VRRPAAKFKVGQIPCKGINMEDRVTQVIQDSTKLATVMFDEYSHKHQWLSQYVSLGNYKLFYTGNLVCDCGEIVWRDEMESIMNIASSLPKIRLFGLRGNSLFVKSAQQSVQWIGYWFAFLSFCAGVGAGWVMCLAYIANR
jgi:hypothetical protein